jgi:hypothetical protein
MLRRSVLKSLQDDLTMQEWIRALIRNDQEAADQYWRLQLRLSEEASAAKADFLGSYNEQRRRLLGLPPLDVRY